MKQISRRRKGRRLQNLVRAKILETFDILRPSDVSIAKTGEGGADIKLSRIAKRILPYQFECKYQERLSTLHRWFAQSKKHGRLEPILICKMNDKKPLLIMDLDHFFDIIKE
ncbi:MAG: hypothetical protein QGH26_03840 [Candidatus Pacebacteria bacterium]|jgi:hypothetical protein|nr:hypothetical protein [Candidatus Paceibacterota bacterium]MDP7159249.1 hypothetical protein [Candidatus Paceibacterota bacterium]|tara:strand:- start:313 stop:648 length:336 start_codon:yes stop_codon:yes gene_type:complete